MKYRAEGEAWKTWEPIKDGQDLWEWQDGQCAWCNTTNGRLVTDHCHMTGLVRGILCSGCNTREGTSGGTEWDAWRSGDNPAWAAKHFEIYRNHMGATPITYRSALQYFTHSEREAWFMVVVQKLRSGEWDKWPVEVPWLETAVARREADLEHLRSLTMDDFLGLGKKS